MAFMIGKTTEQAPVSSKRQQGNFLSWRRLQSTLSGNEIPSLAAKGIQRPPSVVRGSKKTPSAVEKRSGGGRVWWGVVVEWCGEAGHVTGSQSVGFDL